MRIRNSRATDIPDIAEVEQEAARADGRAVFGGEQSFEEWLSLQYEQGDVFVVTDDDDDLNEWGQAGTLDGLQGPVAGYTTLELMYDSDENACYMCQGAVSPQYRRQNVGRLLLQGALNRARLLADEGDEVCYLVVLLPLNDPASPRLAARFEMQALPDLDEEGLQGYGREL